MFRSPKCASATRLDGKTAIITGCNTGIGKATALDFCKRGCRVLMACRIVQKAEEAKNDILKEIGKGERIGILIVKELDLSSLKSVRKCAKEILAEEERVDLLINNAGVFGIPQGVTQDGYEITFATNHLGHFLFTLLLLPRIINSAPARIVNVTSAAHGYYLWRDTDFEDVNFEKHKHSMFRAYGRSKLANILFTKELARRLDGRNVTVYAVYPGWVRTDAFRHVEAAHPYLAVVTNKMKQWVWLLRSPEQGAQTSINCAVDEKAANETGLYYADCKAQAPSKDAQDQDLADKLWDLSVDWVKLEDFDPFKEESLGTKD